MNTGIVVITSRPNSLVYSKETRQVFEWDTDEYSHSEDALNHIELLMMSNHSFEVRTALSDEDGEVLLIQQQSKQEVDGE